MTINDINKILSRLADNPTRENILDFSFGLLQWMNIEPNAGNKPQLLSPQTVQPQLYRISVVETGFKPVSTDGKPVSITTTVTFPSVPTAPSSKIAIKRHGLFEFIRALKSFSSRRINELRDTPRQTLWQSRFHDHIIRNDDSLHRIRDYIVNNPKSWFDDEFYN